MENIDMLISQYFEIVKKISIIAESKNTPGEILSKISEVNDSYIQTCIMTNPNTPSEILEKFLDIYTGVSGVDEEIRIHIVSNVALELDILKKIINEDTSERVRKSAVVSFAKRMVI